MTSLATGAPPPNRPQVRRGGLPAACPSCSSDSSATHSADDAAIEERKGACGQSPNTRLSVNPRLLDTGGDVDVPIAVSPVDTSSTAPLLSVKPAPSRTCWTAYLLGEEARRPVFLRWFRSAGACVCACAQSVGSLLCPHVVKYTQTHSVTQSEDT